MNYITLVGRLTEDPVIQKETRPRLAINLAVPRTYKNQDGIYETDFIRCVLWDALAKRTCEFCHKGDLVGIKGRLQVRNYTGENEETKYISEVMVESLTFLTNYKIKEETNN